MIHEHEHPGGSLERSRATRGLEEQVHDQGSEEPAPGNRQSHLAEDELQVCSAHRLFTRAVLFPIVTNVVL